MVSQCARVMFGLPAERGQADGDCCVLRGAVAEGAGEVDSESDAIDRLTEVTHYRWRREHSGLKGDQEKPLKELEQENLRLRKSLGQHRSTQRKKPRTADEAALTADIIALAKQYGRYSYRRITALLRARLGG
jgi:hypothetical protein